MEELNYYSGLAREAIQNDNDRDKIYSEINNAIDCVYENPEELKALPWIQERKFVSTAPADAHNAAVRTFATRFPRLEVLPLSDAPEEYKRTEDLEDAMEWEFRRMNYTGRKSPHWKIVEYSMRYCAVAIETSYLPWLYQDRQDDPRIQEILRSRNFRWDVHDPSNVHALETDDVLDCVVVTAVKSAYELMKMFGSSNKGIREMLDTFDKKDAASLYSTYYTLYDVTTWDARCKWISPSPSGTVDREAPAGIEILREPRSISFLPWVFVDNQEPLLKQMVKANLWQNLNILRTMQFSKAVDMVAHPEYWIQTPDGTLRSVSIDQTNPNQPLVTGPGTQVQKLVPPQIDPQLAVLLTNAESETFRTTVAQILASVEKYAGTQNFSVVNAMLNAAIAQLSLAQSTAERAETAAMIQNFRWIHETDMPMATFREETKSDSKKKGQELVIKKGMFDPQYLYLNMKLQPSTVMDKQTEINNAINAVERLGKSRKMAWDELNWENFELSESQKAEESLYDAFIQTKVREMLAMAEMKAQMQAQANPAPGGPQSQFSGQQSFPSTAMNPAAQPGQGREQLNSQSSSGQGVA